MDGEKRQVNIQTTSEMDKRSQIGSSIDSETSSQFCQSLNTTENLTDNCLEDKPSPISLSPVARPIAESPVNIYQLLKQFSTIHLFYCSFCFFKLLILNQCITLHVNILKQPYMRKMGLGYRKKLDICQTKAPKWSFMQTFNTFIPTVRPGYRTLLKNLKRQIRLNPHTRYIAYACDNKLTKKLFLNNP